MKTATTRCVLALSAALILTACSTLRVGSDFDRAAHFSGYHRFAWMEREHQGSSDPLVVHRAHDAIEAELLRKGFVAAGAPDQADFVVDFTIGSRERMEVNTYPSAYARYGWWGGQGWWDDAYWGDQVNVRQYREGTLSVDVFDGLAHRPVWHGWAKKELTRSDIENSEAPIRAAVASVLENFPPR